MKTFDGFRRAFCYYFAEFHHKHKNTKLNFTSNKEYHKVIETKADDCKSKIVP